MQHGATYSKQYSIPACSNAEALRRVVRKPEKSWFNGVTGALATALLFLDFLQASTRTNTIRHNLVVIIRVCFIKVGCGLSNSQRTYIDVKQAHNLWF